MGTQKNRQNETVLSSPQNKCGKWWIKNYSQIYAELFCLSWHTTYDRARMELKQLMSQSMNFGSYSISEQRLLRRAYTNAHIRQSFHWSHTQNGTVLHVAQLHYTSTLYIGPRGEKTCCRGFANNKGADQTAHPCSLTSALIICFLKSIISTSKISVF